MQSMHNQLDSIIDKVYWQLPIHPARGFVIEMWSHVKDVQTDIIVKNFIIPQIKHSFRED